MTELILRYVTICTQVLERPSKYHVGAAYLTGQDRADYDDSTHENVLGRLGAYVNEVLGGSTLSKSPHFDSARVKSYPDYSEDFASTLKQLKLMELKAQKDTLSYITQATDVLSVSRIRSLCSSFGVVATPTQLSLASDASSILPAEDDSSTSEDEPSPADVPEPRASQRPKRKTAASTSKSKKTKK